MRAIERVRLLGLTPMWIMARLRALGGDRPNGL